MGESVNSDAILGSLLGTSIGDALGLPYEGLRPRRAQKLLGSPDRYRFLFGRGMVSDDTEHTCLILQALIDSHGEVHQFQKAFARRLKYWFLLLPAGVGLATARACLKLWLGWSPQTSGVRSAGNGPAMRSAILGAAIDDLDQLKALVSTSSRITHTDPRAEQGAFAVAFAAWFARRSASLNPERFFAELRVHLNEMQATELQLILDDVEQSLLASESTTEFSQRKFGHKGVSGYVLHTVPVALHAWLTYPRDLKRALSQSIACGGDTDTVAAIVGGIVGSQTGAAGIPPDLLNHLIEWPRTVEWMKRLVDTYVRADAPAPRCSICSVLIRNLFFLVIVLLHGLRRLLPPY
ncbi:MAG: ADP-ribosylglycohydrolase family protein [Planctomycetaceae bacterium]|nr:ADP-ribosylglycohydrolase family protein [Planctomycetaceae bacterium]